MYGFNEQGAHLENTGLGDVTATQQRRKEEKRSRNSSPISYALK